MTKMAIVAKTQEDVTKEPDTGSVWSLFHADQAQFNEDGGYSRGNRRTSSRTSDIIHTHMLSIHVADHLYRYKTFEKIQVLENEPGRPTCLHGLTQNFLPGWRVPDHILLDRKSHCWTQLRSTVFVCTVLYKLSPSCIINCWKTSLCVSCVSSDLLTSCCVIWFPWVLSYWELFPLSAWLDTKIHQS